MDIEKYLKSQKKIIDKALDKFLPSEKEFPQKIHQAIRYSVFAGGKRLRPILVLASTQIFTKKIKHILPTACAMELIHSYSLIHDDLPCMDDDDYRRGQLTSHKVYGEAIATLAGDALLTYAFFLITNNYKADGVSKENLIRAIREISFAAGVGGMIGGQVVDMQSENKEIDIPTLQYIHTHKTAALICASIKSGAILANASEKEIKALSLYAEYFGLAFQIIDDILDITGDEKKLGKKLGSDIKKKKATYPSVLGLKDSKQQAIELIEKAKASLKIFGNRAKVLVALADFVLSRDR
ncbi:MAG: polyprenyl synthetase family protein [Candidatus Firestonebacteria bacterium]